MATRGWGGSIATAIGLAAGASAAQLGLGYGLGIIAWQPSTGSTDDGAWIASLAWTTWIAAVSAILGAVCADRLSATPSLGRSTARANPARVATGLWRVALALAGAVGALLAVPLVAVPARAAVRADTFTPETTAATYAVAGVLIGLVIAIGSLASRAVAANVIASASWLWLLAIVAVVDGVAGGGEVGTAQLGVWQFSSEGPFFRNVYLPGAALTFGAALIIGLLAPFPAARRGDNPAGVAISGAIGPLLVSAAYFLAAPSGLVQFAPREVSAYWIAPYAVIAGLAGSVIIAAIAPRLQRQRTRPIEDVPLPAAPLSLPPMGGPPTVGPSVQPAPVPTEPLAEDDYAPSRAYASDTVSGDYGDAPAVRGSASVKAPLWPEQTPPPAPSKSRSGRKNR